FRWIILDLDRRRGLRFLHARDQPIQGHNDGMARWQEAAHRLIYLARLGGIESWKFDFVNLKIPEQDAAIVHVHIRLSLRLDDADDFFLTLRRQRKSHAKDELLKVCPR